MANLPFSALVAYPAAHEQPCLCEFPGSAAFQPEMKEPTDLWFASAGSGQPITDPFLALLRTVFWKDGPPNVRGGVFTAMWALRHACEINPGGIKGPERIAVLDRQKGKFRARMLDTDGLAEASNMVDDATRHMARFKDVLKGRVPDKAGTPPPVAAPTR